MPSEKDQRSPKNKSEKTPSRETVEKTEQEPAVERGERLQAGKQIARSGKSDGKVPGAE